jgi:hypothetical protein
METAEPYKLLVEEHGQYLRVEYGGNPLTLEMLMRIVNEVGRYIREKGFDRVLILRDAPLLGSDANRAMVAAMVRTMVGENVRFAIVDIYGNDPRDVARATKASRAAGWALTGFGTEDEAITWLVNES